MDFSVSVSTRRVCPATPLRIVICGGGAGAVLVLQALRQQTDRAIDVTILEPRARLGTGVAYSTNCPLHLLNTRAGNMSVTDDPADFVQWLRRERPRRILNWTPEDFARRSDFADYLQQRLAEIRTAPHLRLTWLRTRADSVRARPLGWQVVPARGAPIDADVVIVATGNEPPRPLGEHLPPPVQRRIIEDPWDAELKAEIPPRAPVLLAGTGLTAVDIAIELLHRGHAAPIVAISRRGLVPQPHGPVAVAPEGLVHAVPASLRAVVRYVRELSASDPHGETWRRVFIELRGIAPALWRGLTVDEKKRFLRHVRPFWDVHRHRLPPRVHERLRRAMADGRLIVEKGRITHIEPLGADALRVSIQRSRGTETLDVARVVNCTGPEVNPARAANPLIQSLIGDGIARVDPLGLGLAVDAASRIVGTNGSAHATLYALGALTRGARWEVTAIPEMKEQATAIVRQLLRDHAAHQRDGVPFGDFRTRAADREPSSAFGT